MRAMRGHPALRDHLVGPIKSRVRGGVVATGRPMNGKEVLHMLNWLTAVASVVLKMFVPADQRLAMNELHLDTIDGRLGETYFFDTPDLTLFRHGLVMRARRTRGADDETVVRLRPAVPTTLSRAVRGSRDFKVEMDVTPGAYMLSAALEARRPVGAVRRTLSNNRPLEQLFSRQQRAFFAEHAPAGVDWNALVPLGPALVVALKPVTGALSERSTVEQWYFPGEIPLIEVSTVVTPGDALGVVANDVKFLRRCWVTAPDVRERSMRRALELFASGLPGAYERHRLAGRSDNH